MKLSKIPLGVVLATLLALIVFTPASAQKLTEKKFQELHKKLQPCADDLWRTIPWKIDLLDAQKTAAKERKPIFIWAMDGHPLGCT